MKRLTTVLLLGVLMLGGLALVADAACTNTPNLSLCKQALGDPNWHTELNNNFDKLDSPVKLVVTGAGPHSIGPGGATTRIGLNLTPSGVAGGAYGAMVEIAGTVTAAANNDALAALDIGALNANTNVAKGAFTGLDYSHVLLNGAGISTTGTGTILNASALKILGAPTAGTNNYALWLSGLARIDGTGDVIFFSGASPNLRVGSTDLRFANNAGSLELMRLTNAGSLELNGARLVQNLINSTYGTSIAINALQGNTFRITATNGTAFTVANPTNALTGQRITITIRNTSGGALGTVTWDTLYKLATWTNPANATSRSITFVYDGTNWVEINRTTTDVPN